MGRGILLTGSHKMLASKTFTFILHVYVHEIFCIVSGKTFHRELTECEIPTQGDGLGKSFHFTELLFPHSFEGCRMHMAGVWCLRAGAAPCALLQPLRVPPCSCRGRQCCARGCVPACRCRTHGSGSRCPGQEGYGQRFWSRDSREFPHPAPSQQSPRLHGPGQEARRGRGQEGRDGMQT